MNVVRAAVGRWRARRLKLTLGWSHLRLRLEARQTGAPAEGGELLADFHRAARGADAREELREEREARGLGARLVRFSRASERVERFEKRVVRLPCRRQRERERERRLALHRRRLARRERATLTK